MKRGQRGASSLELGAGPPEPCETWRREGRLLVAACLSLDIIIAEHVLSHVIIRIARAKGMDGSRYECG